MNILSENTIGEIVAADYRTASVFKSYSIDFCCKGGRILSEVCKLKNISVNTLIKDLESATQQDTSDALTFSDWSLDLLTDYIEKKHHRYVRVKIPEINTYLEKLCQVHGENHPELFKLRDLFTASANDLLAHMTKEEKMLFPVIRAMTETEMNVTPKDQRPHFESVQMPILQMMDEHDTEGNRFRDMATLTGNFTPPKDACTTYRVAFALLKEFEEDLHHHIHLENNILFPKALEMQKDQAYA